ncbi:MAG: enoyl-CoA hydratase, partial [Betaproteobacteria bacterium]
MTDILSHTEAGVMTLTINRVAKKNSITVGMYLALIAALEQAGT